MIIEQIPIGPMANFGYILACEETRIAALIDPAFEPEKLIARAVSYTHLRAHET